MAGVTKGEGKISPQDEGIAESSDLQDAQERFQEKPGFARLRSAYWTPAFVGESGLRVQEYTLTPFFPAKAGIQQIKR